MSGGYPPNGPQGQYQQMQGQPPHPGPGRYPAQPVAYPAQPAAYPVQPAAYPAQPAAYPVQPAGYPAQPAGYPAQPAAYPAQAANPPAAAAPGPAPPPAGFNLPSLPGYENVTFDGGFVAPPQQPPPPQPSASSAPIEVNLRPLTDQQVRDALSNFVSQHCCYGSRPVRDLQIREVTPSSTFKYTLDTFVEKRETVWKCVPSEQSSFPAPSGPAPGPWSVPAAPQQMFKMETRKMEVPNTQTVRTCQDCAGHGNVRCNHCAGRGRVTCTLCGGSGSRLGDQCSRCAGRGTTDCNYCHTNGMVTCKTCNGRCSVRFFVLLTIKWEVHTDQFVVQTRDLPDAEVKKYSGETVTQAEGPRVWPLAGFPEPEVAQASAHLVKKHHTGWPMARILQQRQDVQLVPIQMVRYNYKDDDGAFFVCGREHGVYFPDYPAQCCCCTIL